MPFATYNYVYLEPLSTTGPETRQNRNPSVSSNYALVPGLTLPASNDIAPQSYFTPDVPPATYTNAGITYTFGFMNVSGCGAGQTSSDLSNLPGSAAMGPLIVGSAPINILCVYTASGGSGGTGGGPYIYLDAFDETAGELLNNYFVTGISPDNTLTPNVNIYGSLAVESVAETVTAAANPVHTSGVMDSDANFDKWVALEGPTGNPVITGNSADLVVDGSTADNIAAFAFYQEPELVYITGSYESPDIILFTPFSTTSMGTVIPIVGSDTQVTAGVNYGFAARVHNASTYEASTLVTFWAIPQGNALIGEFLDTQVATVPAGGSTIVYSSVPFVNAGGVDHHTCAAVSLYTPGTASNFNPTSSADAVNIPDPDANIAESFSAWRNTDTQFISPGGPWHIILGLGPIEHFGPAPKVELQVQTQHVAVNFAQNDRVLEIARANRAIYGNAPIYLIPEVRATLPTVELKHEITLVSKGKIEQHSDRSRHILNFEHARDTQFKVSGAVPANAKAGDIYLVQITAHYPKTGRIPAKAVGFLEVLVVK